MDNLGVPSQDLIYTGAWTNWSRGKILGATLTLSQRNGNFLVAFFALFVAFVGGTLFRILCFFLHLKLSRRVEQDGIHHQRQVLLRNSATGLTAIWSLINLHWRWRKVRCRPITRIFPLLVIVTAFTLASWLAGVYSSGINSLMGDEVLLSSPNCGEMYIPVNTTQEENSQIFQPFQSQRMNAFRNYAQECYSKSAASNPKSCDLFVQPRLPRSIDGNANCPFQGSICQTDNKNLRIDTGLLDSNKDLGFNAPEDKRIKFRRVVHCAPLKLDNYMDAYNVSATGLQMLYRRYYYGSRTAHNESYTYLHLDIAKARLTAELGVGEMASYSLQEVTSIPSAPTLTDFNPITELQRDDADVTLMFLSANAILFESEVNDPWYSAHQLVGYQSTDGGRTKMPRYMADNPTSVLGCASQYETCINTATGQKCSGLQGYWTAFTDANAIRNLTQAQRNIIQWLQGASIGTYAAHVPVLHLGADSLISKYSLGDGLQGALPDDQWQKDIQRWTDISLAALQGASVDSATGPASAEIQRYFRAPQNEAGRYFCKNQKIRSTAYANFSILGLAITFSLGALILLCYWLLDFLFDRWLWKYCRAGRYATIEWNTNSALQLHRLAHEEIGSGSWTMCDSENPMTAAGDKLALIDISDIKHPVLETGKTNVGHRLQAHSDTASTVAGGSQHKEEMPGIIVTRTSTW